MYHYTFIGLTAVFLLFGTVGDYFNRDIPAYVLYNPCETAQKVGYEVRGSAF